MNPVEISVRRPVTVSMVMIAITFLGFAALGSLSVDLFPNIDFPLAFIQTPYPGVDPAEMENIVTRKIEEEINTVENIKNVTSSSFEGFSHITVEFNWGTNLDLAAVDLREKVDMAKRKLPRDIEQVTVAKLDINAQPVLEVSLGGAFGLKQLRQMADKEIKPAFERLAGVANVEVFGGLEREIRVKVLPERLRANKITIDDVISGILNDNQNTPVGNITEGSFKYLVRSEGEAETPQQLGNIIIKEIAGRPVYLKEIANIADAHKELESVARLNRKPSVTLQIKKEAGANPVAISDSARELIPKLEAQFQNQLSLTIGKDSSSFIRDSINMVKENATTGAIFAVVVLFLFLRNYSSTLIIGLSIPLAVLGTFAMMYAKHGMTLNLMTLGGLALGIGMMVDNSIVVLENIYRFFATHGELDRPGQAIKATEEVMLPIVASTLTTVAVFLPIGFVPGVIGEIFMNMSLAIVFSLLASLLVAISLVPMMSAKILRLNSPFLEDLFLPWVGKLLSAIRRRKFSAMLFLGGSLLVLVVALSAEPVQGFLAHHAVTYPVLGHLTTTFGPAIAVTGLILLPPFLVIGFLVLLKLFNVFNKVVVFPLFDLVILSLAGNIYRLWLKLVISRFYTRIPYTMAILALFFLSFKFQPAMEFMPKMDQGVFVLKFEMPEGTAIDVSDGVTKQIEELILQYQEVDKVIANSKLGEGNLTVILHPVEKRSRTTNAVIADLRPKIESIPGPVAITYHEPSMGGGGGGKPIQIEVFGDQLPVIEDICRSIAEKIKTVPGLKDLDNGVKTGRPEVKIKFDREKIRDLGVNLGTIAGMTRSFIFGTLAGKYKEANEEYDIRVEAADVVKDDLEKLSQLPLVLEKEKFVPLSQVATTRHSRGYTRIQRRNLKRQIKVQADILERPLGAVVEDIKERIKDISIPPGYGINFGGENEEMTEAFGNLGIALIASILLVYMIMGGQFESLMYPFIIMFTIPMSYIGVVLALRIAGFAFSITAMIGLIMLAGIVVNNGIILIEYINQRRRDLKEDRLTATMEACMIRFRPILMTVSTTVLGMLPLAMGIGAGSDFYQPLAITVMGGLLVSTLLTLTFVPALYVIFDDIIVFTGNLFSRLFTIAPQYKNGENNPGKLSE